MAALPSTKAGRELRFTLAAVLGAAARKAGGRAAFDAKRQSEADAEAAAERQAAETVRRASRAVRCCGTSTLPHTHFAELPKLLTTLLHENDALLYCMHALIYVSHISGPCVAQEFDTLALAWPALKDAALVAAAKSLAAEAGAAKRAATEASKSAARKRSAANDVAERVAKAGKTIA